MEKISRRSALKIMGASVAAVALSGVTSQAKEIERIAKKLSESHQDNNGPTMPAPDSNYVEKVVYKGKDVTIRQIDEHTWVGNGHLMYNESIYIVEGEDKALLIDAGTAIEDLDKIVASITKKPVTLVATHVHPDHTGEASIKYFPELYISAADEVMIPSIMPNYKGQVKYMNDGMVWDLGGRQIEVIFTPGHTPGSCTFFDKERHYGFSGDSFGSTNLLLMTNFSTLMATTFRTKWYMQKHGITKLYPGHYSGNNLETFQRISDEYDMSVEMLEGKREGNPSDQRGLNGVITDHGVNIRYRDPEGIK